MAQRKAFDVALKMVAATSKSRAGLERGLLAKGFDPAEVTQAIERLGVLGYVNDERHAQARALALLAQGRGRADVLRRLEVDGVPAAVAQSALSAAELEAGYDELGAARALLARRRVSGLKAARLLASRGFSEDIVRKLCRLDEEMG